MAEFRARYGIELPSPQRSTYATFEIYIFTRNGQHLHSGIEAYCHVIQRFAEVPCSSTGLSVCLLGFLL